MLSLEELVKRLKDRQDHVIAQETGISARTIGRIRRNESTRPDWDDVEKLSNYFEEQERDLGLIKQG